MFRLLGYVRFYLVPLRNCSFKNFKKLTFDLYKLDLWLTKQTGPVKKNKGHIPYFGIINELDFVDSDWCHFLQSNVKCHDLLHFRRLIN